MDGELELLGERIAEQSAHLDAALHRLLTDLREFDQRGGWHVQGAVSCAHWLAWRVGWNLVTARQHVRVAHKLAELPAIDDALRRGTVSYAKVRAMVRVATPANESLLLAYANLMTASQLEIQCRKLALVLRNGEKPHPLIDEQRRYVRRRDTEDCMVKIEAVLHPEEAELVWAMLDHAAAQRTRRPDVAGCEDSVDPQAVQAPCAAVATPSTGDVASGINDSAESHVAMESPGTALSSLAGKAAGGSDDSAESQVVQGPVAVAVSQREYCAGGGIDDSAESREPETASTGSLLDRLLDEAEALRSAEAAPRRASSGLPNEATSRPGISVLRQREDAVKRAFNRADALVSLAQCYLRGERPDRSPIEITLMMSESSLRAETVDSIEVGEIGQSFVSREAARRLSCDAGVVEVVEDATGAPLSVGRKRRTISGPLKRALYRRDQSCTFPGCTHRIFLEGHHIKHWADGGETSLLNAALLRTAHHRYVHEYGYSIELGPDHRPRF